jgi:hypothetical protein
MKRATLVLAVWIASPLAAVASPPNVFSVKRLMINADGVYHDKAVWLYRTAKGMYTFGTTTDGTNETLVMPSPSPEPGGAVVGVELLRHRFNAVGYPMHISLVEKLFAASNHVAIYAASSGDSWTYAYGDPVTNETPVGGVNSRSAFKAWGPFHADAVPLSQAPEPEIAVAFNSAKDVLNAIANLPDAQKDMTNYGVLFIDDGQTVWVELGPRFGPTEAPHLGCQTQLGRDLVIGYPKKQSAEGKSGAFLQCF